MGAAADDALYILQQIHLKHGTLPRDLAKITAEKVLIDVAIAVFVMPLVPYIG
ncbi:hypothetical protein [Pantanalinema sp. GBBB05]|uniref:hypothetical protein n=1 Tax=Pantanalinema sp. GBBB05 TaxID=2604139 RepID=UPI003D81519C